MIRYSATGSGTPLSSWLPPLLGDEQAGDLALYPRRHHHGTRIGQRLRPRRDVRHVAKYLAGRVKYDWP
jgi:hypothetical protein